MFAGAKPIRREIAQLVTDSRASPQNEVIAGSWMGQSCLYARHLGGDELTPHRWAFQLDPVGAVNDAVEDR